MLLKPMDVIHREFRTGFRGYSKEQVAEFQREVASGLEELIHENTGLKEQVQQLKDKLSYYERIEETMQNALVMAERAAEEWKKAAEQKADAIVREAQARAKEIIDDALRKASEIQRQVADLIQKRDEAEVELRTLLKGTLEILERYRRQWGAPEIPETPETPAPSHPPVMLAGSEAPSSRAEGEYELRP